MSEHGMRDLVEYIWLRSYPVFVGVLVALASWNWNLGERAFHDDIQGSVFGGILGLAGLLVSILLGLLGILSALEHRQVVQEMRRNQRLYKQLVSLCLEGIVVFLLLAALSLAGLFLYKGETRAQAIIGGANLAFCATGLAEALRFSLQLIRVLTDREPPKDKSPDQLLAESRSRLPPLKKSQGTPPARSPEFSLP